MNVGTPLAVISVLGLMVVAALLTRPISAPTPPDTSANLAEVQQQAIAREAAASKATAEMAAQAQTRKKGKDGKSAEQPIDKEAAFQRVALALMLLKRSMRNPDSFVLEDISGTYDAKVLCFTYRAQNGFGGMNLEHMTMAAGKASTEPGHWNRHCARKSNFKDWTYAKHAL